MYLNPALEWMYVTVFDELFLDSKEKSYYRAEPCGEHYI